MLNLSIMYLLIVLSFFNVFKNKDHLLSCLLNLEGISLLLLFFIFLMMMKGVFSYSGFMTFMYVMVAEGALGLSILVCLVREVGNDKFFYQNVL